MIYKYNTAPTPNLNDFYNWLIDHKNDTFLKDVNITYDNNTEYQLITFSKNGVTIKFKCLDSTMSSVSIIDIITYTSSVVNKVWNSASYTGNTSSIAGALICNNGIILKIRTKDSSSSYSNINVPIVFDDDNDLALIIHSSNLYTTAENRRKKCALVSDSTNEPYLIIESYFDSLYTSLGHLVPDSISYKLISKYFIALYTQVSSIGFYSVTFDGTNYITDGIHYIED